MHKHIFEEGRVLLIDKPYGWTSFDVVRKLRSLLKIKKIGHAGTLDPLATGLLVVCTGRLTKKINEYMAQEKEYTGIILLGATTPTYDLESVPRDFKNAAYITAEAVSEAARQFTGEIMQVPPVFSAVKKDGRRAYELARRGKEVELAARKITVKRFTTDLRPPAPGSWLQETGTGSPVADPVPLLRKTEARTVAQELRLPEVHFTIVCSTGTYIRTLAHDLGAALSCGGFLGALRRTRTGDFHVRDAWTMEEAQERIRALCQS